MRGADSIQALGQQETARTLRPEAGLKNKLLLLWLAGVSLRLTILAVPPVISQIHHQLHLDETAVGILTGLPIVLLAAVAVPGSLLVAKLGPRRAILLGLSVITLGGALRGVDRSTVVLFAMTLVMGCGVAVSQPALPSLVRSWLPGRIGLATALFSNGLLIGEVVPVALTVPLVLPLVVGSWPASLAFWSIPVALTAAAILLFTRGDRVPAGTPPARWWPDWHDTRTWQLGLILGGASAAYWSGNAFIPDFLRAHHHADLITPALTSLNLIQLPASLLVALAPKVLIRRRWPLTMAGIITVIGGIGLVVLPPNWFVADAGLVGFSTALVFVLSLALPPILAERGDTHRLSAAVFTISYTCPFLGSFIGGGLWDLTGISQTAFTPLLAGGVMVALFPLWLRLERAGTSPEG